MKASTIIPKTGLMQRRGLDNALMRVVTVHLNANKACAGGKPLHEVHALRVTDGKPMYWFATDDEARRYRWI